MPEQQHLRQLLEQLHAELQRAPALDDRSRELLGSALSDIQDLLERSEESGKRPEPIIERLREAVGAFEETHPTLTEVVSRLVDALATMGI